MDNKPPADVLDMGATLKQEKIQKVNIEKVEKLKSEAEQKREETRRHKREEGLDTKLPRWVVPVLLIILLTVGMGLRFYVASMPITGSWAEDVVSANLQNQVNQKINEQYSTLSDAKKNELIETGKAQALASEKNKETIQKLSEQYKDSYKNPEGQQYLYEIDPYLFYEIAASEDISPSILSRNLLGVLEKKIQTMISLFIPDITLATVAFYIPGIFTFLVIIIFFFITKEIWDITAASIGTLFLVLQPLFLEFSLLGFTDTNILNVFFILGSGLFFILFIKAWKEKKWHAAPKLIIYGFLYVLLIEAFRYTWSAWYVAFALPCLTLFLFTTHWLFMSRIGVKEAWGRRKPKEKKILLGICVILLIAVTFFVVQQGPEDAIKNLLPYNVKVYLHMDFDNPFGVWPDAFSLIKELQVTSTSSLIEYSGGPLYVILAIIGFCLVLYKKPWSISSLYLICGTITFTVLTMRAIRLLPYLIPFFAISIGVTGSFIMGYAHSFIEKTLRKDRLLRYFSYFLLYIILMCVLVLPLVPKIEQKAQIMPIMDDAIYNSAMFIKENSSENALVNTWWDRGTFYRALTERNIHINSQPHMPRTYWISLLYTTTSDNFAKNTLWMLNCEYGEYTVFKKLKMFMSEKEAIDVMKIFMYEEDREVVIDSTTEFIYAYFKERIIQGTATESEKAMLSQIFGNHLSATRDRLPFYLNQDTIKKIEKIEEKNLNIANWFVSEEIILSTVGSGETTEIIFIKDAIRKYFFEDDKGIKKDLECTEETYVVVLDDMMGRFTGTQYLASWNYELNMPEPNYPFNDLNEGNCARTTSGFYCEVAAQTFFANMSDTENIKIQGTTPVQEILVAYNQEVLHQGYTDQVGMSLIIYERDGYWKALFIPKEVADSFYVRLMLLDGYGFESFEKVFEEVHIETAWAKVYKVKFEE